MTRIGSMSGGLVSTKHGASIVDLIKLCLLSWQMA